MKPIKELPSINAPSGRFVLRPFRSGDEMSLVKHINSSRIAERVSNIPYPYTDTHAKEWIARLEEERTASQYTHRIDFAITVSDEVVGSIAFINIDGHKAQMSYWLGEEFQGKGIMPEALALVVEFGFVTCGFTRIWGYTWENNLASQHVLEKVGFMREGVHRKEWLKNGVYHDSVMYAIVR
jgi:ribosomal-protein-alanine N-acetyltransferase